MLNLPKNAAGWVRLCLLNLAVVATLGALLRYKILFPLPWLHQKFLLHAHSHFAFAGWITQILMVLLVSILHTRGGWPRRYQWLLQANLVCAWGMLAAFSVQGYGFWSILFSTLGIGVFYSFAWCVRKDLVARRTDTVTAACIQYALLFGVLSTFGSFALAWQMVSDSADPHLQLASVYFYLHFQYNGWFLFALLALLLQCIPGISRTVVKRPVQLLAFTCVPAFLLSVLWLPMPLWMRVLIAGMALLQLLAWLRIATVLWFQKQRGLPPLPRVLLAAALTAGVLKCVLQVLSLYPGLADLAFGFRTIVVGYLHLVLLGFISLGVLAYVFFSGRVNAGRCARLAAWSFAALVVLNELLLALQGLAALFSLPFACAGYALFVTALGLSSSAWTLYVGAGAGQRRSWKNTR